MNLDELDPTFKEDLFRSSVSVSLTAAWFSIRGHDAFLPGLKARPTPGERERFKDRGDLLVHVNGEEWQTIEVIHRRDGHFTSAEDFPYPTVIVCTETERERIDPFLYLVFDVDLSHVAVINPAKTAEEWTLEEHTIGGRAQTVHACPTSLCNWRPFPLSPGSAL